MKLRQTLLALTIGAATATAIAAAQTPVQLEPFVANYSVAWKSINAGTSQLQLERRSDGRYLYTSRSNARGMYKLIFSDEIIQTSTIEVSEHGVRPLRYRGDDGSDDTDRDVNLEFNWSTKQIVGVAEDEPVRLDLIEGMQDPMSIQLAIMYDLRANRPVTGYQMADKDKIKSYVYTYEGKQRIDTALGALDTVVYSSHRQDSDKRITRTWHAPSLGYIPVKAERLRDGKREVLLQIQSYEPRR